jgi:SAM-dependent methyltransferase
MIASCFKDEPKITDAFRNGHGVGWHEHDAELFEGTERFFRPNYLAHLVGEWIPALDGMRERLQAGAKVADVGCGLGAATILMAQAFPKSRFLGYDYHRASIETAVKRARGEGLSERVIFKTASAKDFPGRDYDMGDPVGAAAHVRRALKPDGVWMIVEPYAEDAVERNLNPIGRVFYSASTMICTPASRAQEVGLALGAQAGEQKIREVAMAGGFTHFRRATETPFNLIFEARL